VLFSLAIRAYDSNFRIFKELLFMSNMLKSLPNLNAEWRAELEEECAKAYFSELMSFLEEEYASNQLIFPPEELIFNAFNQTPFHQVSVVIMGQDPYHGLGQAHGLSFSVDKGINPPPSLKNIFKELYEDLAISPPAHGCLLQWARQGVLLLNATLTVRCKKPKSHYGRGWERFTDAVISRLAEREEPIIFVLWGKSAQEKCQQLEQFSHSNQHIVLTSPHPSPYSANSGFFGCGHFSKVNSLLVKQGKAPIDWEIR
jgi:uracil-DNA glycosylase